MPLVKCPECRTKISDSAKSCPRCGFSDNREVGAGCERQNPVKSSLMPKTAGQWAGWVLAICAVLLVLNRSAALLDRSNDKADEPNVVVTENSSEPSSPEWQGSMSKSKATTICQGDVKRRIRNPSTVEFGWLTGTDNAVLASGELVVVTEFTAKNDFNAEQSYTAVCIFDPNGGNTIEISRR